MCSERLTLSNGSRAEVVTDLGGQRSMIVTNGFKPLILSDEAGDRLAIDRLIAMATERRSWPKAA